MKKKQEKLAKEPKRTKQGLSLAEYEMQRQRVGAMHRYFRALVKEVSK